MSTGEVPGGEDASPRPDWLLTTLQELGLDYAIRQTPRGERYAGLQLATPSGRWLGLTLISLGGTLRVTAHEVAADPGAIELAARNRGLPLARCFVGEPGTIDVAIDVYTGAAVLSGDQLGGLLRHLDQSVTATLGGLADLALPAMGAPDLAGGVDLAAMTAGRLVLELRPEGWLEARAVPPHDIVVADARAFATLDRLQNWTRAGKYVLTENGSLHIRVLTPLLGHREGLGPADPIGWSIDQSMVMGQVAQRHLGS